MSDESPPPDSSPRTPVDIRYCIACRKPIQGDKPYERDGFHYCRPCWAAVRARTAGTHYRKEV